MYRNIHIVLMCVLDSFSSSSSNGTPVANAFELKARDPDDEDDAAADESHSVSSRQTVDPASSPIEMTDEHVSALDYNHPVAPEPRVNHLWLGVGSRMPLFFFLILFHF